MNSASFFLITTILISEISATHQEDVWQHSISDENTWQEPNAWDRHSRLPEEQKRCPTCDECKCKRTDEKLALLSYQKLIRNLLNKKILKKSEVLYHFERELVLTISEEQLQTIENSSNINDLSEVIDNILANVKTPNNSNNNEKNNNECFATWDFIVDCIKNLKELLQISEARFGLFVFGVSTAIWLFHKRYNKNLIVVLVGIFFFIGFAFNYAECNKKLKAEEFIQFVEESSPDEDGFLKKLYKSIFRLSEKEEKIKKIKKDSELKLPFCRPDHVLMMYINELFLGQLELIIDKCSTIITNFSAKLPFAHGIIASVCLPLLLVVILRYLFQYTLNPIMWYRLLTNNTHPQPAQGPNQQNQHNINHPVANVDHLSGNNLRIVLNALAKNASNVPSGVEEINSTETRSIEEPDENKNKKMLGKEDSSKTITYNKEKASKSKNVEIKNCRKEDINEEENVEIKSCADSEENLKEIIK